jgi:hypothetical protein
MAPNICSTTGEGSLQLWRLHQRPEPHQLSIINIRSLISRVKRIPLDTRQHRGTISVCPTATPGLHAGSSHARQPSEPHTSASRPRKFPTAVEEVQEAQLDGPQRRRQRLKQCRYIRLSHQ